MRHSELTAIQLVYLVAGAEDVIDEQRAKNRVVESVDYSQFTEQVSGHIGMTHEFLPLAEIVAGYLTGLKEDQDFPGVFEYEVTERLGEWLVRNWGNFTPDIFLAEVESQGALFFAQSA